MSEEGNRGAGEVREREQKQEQVSSTHPRQLYLLKARDPASPPAPFSEFHPPKALPMNSVLPPPLPRSSTLLALSPRSLLTLSKLAVLLAVPLKMPSAYDPTSGCTLSKPSSLPWPWPCSLGSLDSSPTGSAPPLTSPIMPFQTPSIFLPCLPLVTR